MKLNPVKIARRQLFTLLAASSALAACTQANGHSTLDPNVAKVAGYVSTIANGLAGTLQQLSTMTVPGLSGSVVAATGAAVSGLEKLAGQIQDALTTTAQQPLVQQVYQLVQQVFTSLVPVLSAIPDPTVQTIVQAIQAAQVLLPVIFGIVQLAMPASAPRFSMAPDTAELILKGKAQFALVK